MAAETSGIPNFKAQLQTALQARAGLAGVVVYRRWPVMPEPEYIWLATARGRQRIAASRGPNGGNPREEASIQDVIVHTVKSNIDDENEASDRVFALMAEIEQELRLPTSTVFTSLSCRFAEIARYELDEWIDADQSYASLLIEVDWAKRLNP